MKVARSNLNNMCSAKNFNIKNTQAQNINFSEILKSKNAMPIRQNQSVMNKTNDFRSSLGFSVIKYNLSNKEDLRACSKSYAGIIDGYMDFKKSSPNYYTGDYIHEYDLGDLKDTYGSKIKNAKIFGFTSCNGDYRISIQMNGNKNYILNVQGWQKDEPMDRETFEKVVLKGLQITMAEENQIQKIMGTRANLFSSGTIEYDPNTKNVDFSKMINFAIDSISTRLERLSIDFSKNVAQQYIDEFMTEVNKIIKIK